MRIYDPRVGKFLSVDPLTKSYPFMTPYAFAENDVIRSIDLDGLEKYLVIYEPIGNSGVAKIIIRTVNNIKTRINENMKITFTDHSENDQSAEILRIRNGFTMSAGKSKDQHNSSNFHKGESFIINNASQKVENDKDFSVTVTETDSRGREKVVGESLTFSPAKFTEGISEGWGAGYNFKAGAFNTFDGMVKANYDRIKKAAGKEALKKFQIIITTDSKMDDVVQKTYTDMLTKKYGKDVKIKWDVSDHDSTISARSNGQYDANVSVTATK
ncbi:hypothetical protein A3860_06865 [Niastella vici]|uniref:RHS repeat-associated core domain-containing protein n=2 Tax=Niastella vici TaxID=1703345 RepID=A0A1V9FKN7_9BACT|nr:hypothetical protein A3860_06865 [Niastella vici]